MPHRRHALAKRRVALVTAAAYCGTRAVAYAPWVDRQQSGVEIATGGGLLLPVFAVLWAAVALWCLACIPSGRIITAMAATAGMMACWGAIWGVAWLINPHTLWWQTALTYGGPAVLVASLTVLTPRDSEDR